MHAARVVRSTVRERAGSEVVVEDLRGLHYKPVRVLGEGSHGIVLLVEHVRLGKPFVMKLIQQRFLANKDVVGRFIAEAQRGARLNHEAFAPIVDLGEAQDGRTYFVMEYVEGVTLQQALRDCGALPLDHALVLALQLLDGLAAAHDAHLIHRDIKPANLLLTTRGRLKILDLGISKSMIDSGTGPNTAHGVAIGTPKYMSPEQAKGQPVSTATDLYAVALVLFEMLTGEAVFDGSNAQELLRHHIFSEPPTLAQRAKRAFPDALEQVIACTLRKDPAERSQTAREMQAALHQVLESTRAELGISAIPMRSSSPSFTPSIPAGVERTTDERARPTIKVSESAPPEAFHNPHVASVLPGPSDRSSTRPVSAESLLIGSASTLKQAIMVQPGTNAGEATTRTETLAAIADAQPVETGGATTRTHDGPAPIDRTVRSPIGGTRPLLVFAAILGGVAAVLVSVAALVLLFRSSRPIAPSPAAAASVVDSAQASTSASVAPAAVSAIADAIVDAEIAAAASVSVIASTTASSPKPPPKAKGTSHYQAAIDAMNSGDLETADTEARLAVIAGGGTQAQLLRANILEKRGKKAAAKESYRQILAKDPTMAAAVAGLKRCGG